MSAAPHCDFRHSILSRKCFVVTPKIVVRITNVPEWDLEHLFVWYF